MTEKKENQRSMRYSARSKADAIAWQKAVRSHLARLLRIEDLQSSKHETGLNPRAVSTKKKDGYTLKEIEINSTPGRRNKLVATAPRGEGDRFPAVVCIHGHEGSRHIVYLSSLLAFSGFHLQCKG